MKFKICWLEYHICETDEEMQEKLDMLPSDTRITGTNPYNDEAVEFECIDYFEADSIEEAKEYVKEEYNVPNDDFEVFAVFDEQGEVVFTEEDLEG